MIEEKKTGIITVTKMDGTIMKVESDFHIDELFKIVHHMRTKLSDGHPDKDVLRATEKMGWPIMGGGVGKSSSKVHKAEHIRTGKFKIKKSK